MYTGVFSSGPFASLACRHPGRKEEWVQATHNVLLRKCSYCFKSAVIHPIHTAKADHVYHIGPNVFQTSFSWIERHTKGNAMQASLTVEHDRGFLLTYTSWRPFNRTGFLAYRFLVLRMILQTTKAPTTNSPAPVERFPSRPVDSLHVQLEEFSAARQTRRQLRVESVSSQLTADSSQCPRNRRRRCKT